MILPVLIFLSLGVGNVLPLELTINPPVTSDLSEDDVTMRCSLTNEFDRILSISYIQLSRAGDKTSMASLYPINHTIVHDSTNAFEAEGFIDVIEPANSFLQVKLLNPSHGFSGSYVCHVSFLDKDEKINTSSAEADLKVKRVDMLSLVRAVEDNRQRIKDKDSEINNKNSLIDEMRIKINDLERKSSRKDSEFSKLKQMIFSSNRSNKAILDSIRKINDSSIRLLQTSVSSIISHERKQDQDIQNLTIKHIKDMNNISKRHGIPRMNEEEYCPSGWRKGRDANVCYRSFYQAKTWTLARDICLYNNARLIDITNKNTTLFLITSFPNRHIWIGLNDQQTEGHYVWDGYSKLGSYTNWAKNEPTAKNDCATVSTDEGKWHSRDCQQRYGFLCQVESLSESK